MHEPLRFQVGEIIVQDELIQKLETAQYAQVKTVEEPGQYAVRGSSIDLYPVSYRAPIRIHFVLDRINTIRDYSLHEGKSLTAFEEVFILPVTETFLKKAARFRAEYDAFEPIEGLGDIKPGDYVVHIEYGIGRFIGTKRLKTSGESKKHLAIEYADKELLYLPLDHCQLIDRYLGMEGKKPKLTRLRSKEWIRIKEKTMLAVQGIAKELVAVQAKRQFQPGYSFPSHTELQKEFEKDFPFEETPDQRKATDNVNKDMESKKPMDRLLS